MNAMLLLLNYFLLLMLVSLFNRCLLYVSVCCLNDIATNLFSIKGGVAVVFVVVVLQ